MRLWTKFKLALLAGLTVTMMWHWQVVEADAYIREKSDGIPWAIVPGDALATPSGAEKAPMVEPVPIETEPEVDEEELYMLAHLLAGECQSYSRECQVAVASVVMNRVKHPSYPNSVEGVIFQHGQYACVRDGNYDREPTALNWEVAEEVLRYGSQIPVNVVFQAQFKQGPCWKKIDGEYFCGLEE